MPTATVTAVATPDRRETCRYLTHRSHRRTTSAALDRCTGEVVEEGAEIALCSRHLGEALALLTRHGLNPGGTNA